jgi:hypothetical protein
MSRADDVIREIIAAWERPGSGQLTGAKIQRWLIEDMKPAIDVARKYLADVAEGPYWYIYRVAYRRLYVGSATQQFLTIKAPFELDVTDVFNEKRILKLIDEQHDVGAIHIKYWEFKRTEPCVRKKKVVA